MANQLTIKIYWHTSDPDIPDPQREQDDYDLEQESSLIPEVIKSIRTCMAGKPVSRIRVG
jgi:hypothetical protein